MSNNRSLLLRRVSWETVFIMYMCNNKLGRLIDDRQHDRATCHSTRLQIFHLSSQQWYEVKGLGPVSYCTHMACCLSVRMKTVLVCNRGSDRLTAIDFTCSQSEVHPPQTLLRGNLCSVCETHYGHVFCRTLYFLLGQNFVTSETAGRVVVPLRTGWISDIEASTAYNCVYAGAS